MMSSIREILVNDATLNSLVQRPSGRGWIYPEHIPQGAAFPAMFYSKLGVRPTLAKEQDAGMDFNYIRLTIYANDYDVLQNIADAVKGALHYVPRGIYDNIYIDRITLDTEMGGSDDKSLAYQRILDFVVQVKTIN